MQCKAPVHWLKYTTITRLPKNAFYDPYENHSPLQKKIWAYLIMFKLLSVELNHERNLAFFPLVPTSHKGWVVGTKWHSLKYLWKKELNLEHLLSLHNWIFFSFLWCNVVLIECWFQLKLDVVRARKINITNNQERSIKKLLLIL